ncbi:hypothetical protein [Brunnivagina elsteri]|uniref:hypothetical protein n=1 Tax=Brunnivagina elsteri TaxID=1247191 RepID=UPI00130433DA|nr:hypothetical protein [Calothrix elsteri]
MDDQEIILNAGKIICKGNTIRRPINENSGFVQELLRYLEIVNFDLTNKNYRW